MTTKSQLDHLLRRLVLLMQFCFVEGSPVSIHLQPKYDVNLAVYVIDITVYNDYYEEKLTSDPSKTINFMFFSIYSFRDFEENFAVFYDAVKFAAWRPDGKQPDWFSALISAGGAE